MVYLFKKDQAALENNHPKPLELTLDLTSGNELSIEGKEFCAKLCTQEEAKQHAEPQTLERMEQIEKEEKQTNIDVSALIENYERAEIEEAALIGVKQYLTETLQELQTRIKKELEAKIKNINSLRSEIEILEDNCKKLSTNFNTAI
jgi:hypothetical protein